jgi:hypothetical protein
LQTWFAFGTPEGQVQTLKFLVFEGDEYITGKSENIQEQYLNNHSYHLEFMRILGETFGLLAKIEFNKMGK